MTKIVDAKYEIGQEEPMKGTTPVQCEVVEPKKGLNWPLILTLIGILVLAFNLAKKFQVFTWLERTQYAPGANVFFIIAVAIVIILGVVLAFGQGEANGRGVS